MKEKHVSIIIMTRTREDHLTLYTIISFAKIKNVIMECANFHITNWNNCIIPIVIKLNFVNIIKTELKNAHTKTSAHLLTPSIK